MLVGVISLVSSQTRFSGSVALPREGRLKMLKDNSGFWRIRADDRDQQPLE
jgi:hypothetical protein